MEEQYFPTVVQAIPGAEKTVYAYFTDGQIKHYDMKPLIAKGGVFAQLQDDQFFTERLTVLNGTIAWDLSGHYDPRNCIDIDPFEVYEASSVCDPLTDAG
jgi:hypothetical protein